VVKAAMVRISTRERPNQFTENVRLTRASESKMGSVLDTGGVAVEGSGLM